MATQYDSNLIEIFADRLYAQAKTIVIKYAFVFGIIGAAGAGAYGRNMTWAIVGAVIGAVIGYTMAQERAYQLRLQAQTALCQVQIEKNTRK